MPRIPDRIAVASLTTHRLIVTVDKRGTAETYSSLPRETAAAVLRQLAEEIEPTRLGGLDTPSAAARPANRVTDEAPASPPATPLLTGISAAEVCAGFEDFGARVAAAMSRDDDEHQAAEEPPALIPEDVRAALAFNEGEHDQALHTLRDVLLDTTATRTPEQALAAARILLTAHARQVAALIEAHHRATRTRWGLSRSTRGLLTGYEGARKLVTRYADHLADEQALDEADR
ncbi:hypothetical protein [Streptomyces sp. NPDC047046]|uniref:hypothetical protein n=1 Tax=Streptomyces sp. NPDC047046 TaxID=3155378 RepID=UPI0033EBA76E